MTYLIILEIIYEGSDSFSQQVALRTWWERNQARVCFRTLTTSPLFAKCLGNGNQLPVHARWKEERVGQQEMMNNILGNAFLNLSKFWEKAQATYLDHLCALALRITTSHG